jgi:hypothetical protein
MGHQLKTSADGAIECSDGWAVRVLTPEMLEYCHGPAACLVNIGYWPGRGTRAIYASESSSELFPQLIEHLQTAARHLKGNYVVV